MFKEIGLKMRIYFLLMLSLAVMVLSTSLTVGSGAKIMADGDLDPMFGTAGIATTDFTGSEDIGSSVAIQTDGKIVVAGLQSVAGTPHFGLARYNTNGSLDTTFNGNGKVSTPIGFTSGARALAIQTDGKIVVAGTTDAGINDSDFAIVRYNANGSIDTTFAINGIAKTRFLTGIDNIAHAVIIQSDGKIVAAGESSNITMKGGFFKHFALARYNTNGSLDTAFGTDGKLTTTFAVTAAAKSVSIHSDGKITAAGTQNLARYSSSGALDSSFGTGGRVFINNISINAAKIQADGNIVVAGSTVVSGEAHFGLARITPTGVFDTAFGTSGRVSTNFGELDIAQALVLQSDGKMIAAGTSSASGNSDFALARYNANGSLDTTFGGDGKVTTNISIADTAAGAALQPDGKIIAVGSADAGSAIRDFAVARYQNGGSTVVPRQHQFDFDGDFRDDLSVFRPLEGNWYIQRSTAGFAVVNWGLAGDHLTPADFDGDGKTDVAVWREGAQSTFFILQSATSTVHIDHFGNAGDVPTIVGDWDGDGKAEPAVYRDGPQSIFFYRGSLNNPAGDITFLPWGLTGDRPVRGDFDGDGMQDAAVFRPSNAVWFIRRSSDGNLQPAFWGLASDTIVNGDFDADGKTDLAVFRPSDRTWYIRPSSDGQPIFQQWGLPTDILVPADYDGDGRTDVAVWRPSDRNFWILQSSTSSASVFNFGRSGDVPIPSAFVR
jgi:uncharacterized delta-60 repeat protein